MAWPTAQTVVTQAARELGLIGFASEFGDDAFSSSDGIVGQLLALLKKAGRDLVDEFEWMQLRQQYSFITGVNAQTWSTYPLPLDWRAMINQSGWNRSTRLPLGGPMSEQEWQYLLGFATGVTLNVLFRPMQGLLSLYPENGVAAGQTISMAYKSSWWVQEQATAVAKIPAWADATDYKFGAIVTVENAPENGPYVKNVYRCVYPGTSAGDPPGGLADAGGSSEPIYGTTGKLVWNWIGCTTVTEDGITPTFGWSTTPSSGADVLLFDEALLVAKLKMLWKREKGFDTSDVEREYQRQFMAITANNQGAPILSLNGNGAVADRLLGGLNVPITGFGS